MFMVKSGAVLGIFAPFGRVSSESNRAQTEDAFLVDTTPWKNYTTKENKFYDKEQVWDLFTVNNGQIEVPAWAEHNIREFGVSIISSANKSGETCFAMVKNSDIQYVG